MRVLIVVEMLHQLRIVGCAAAALAAGGMPDTELAVRAYPRPVLHRSARAGGPEVPPYAGAFR